MIDVMMCGCCGCDVHEYEICLLPIDDEEYTGINVCPDCFIKHVEV